MAFARRRASMASSSTGSSSARVRSASVRLKVLCPSSSMVDSPSSANINHRARWRNKIRIVDTVPGFFGHNHAANLTFDIAVTRAAAKKRLEIVILFAEKAGAQFPVSGQANARAESAKRLRDRRNQANFAAPVGKSEFPSGLAALMRHRYKRPFRLDAPLHLRCRNHQLASPRAVSIERHKFDEAHNQIAFARKFGEALHF